MLNNAETPEPIKVCARCKQACERGSVHRWRCDDGQKPALYETLCPDCDHDEAMAEYRKTGLMTTNVRTAAAIYMGDVGYQTGGADGGWIEWMRGPERAEQRVRISLRIRARAHHAADYRKIHAAGEDIYTAVKVFEQSVWFHWLKGYWNKTQARGHKASIDGLTLLVWGCAGRVMMTLRDPATKASVTVITDAFSNEPCMTAQGIEATREDALRLLAEARAHRGALRIAMKPDAAVVKMAGL